MVATNMKAETKSLMDKRRVLEAEWNAIISCLSQPDGRGLSYNLLDSEGLSRSNIDNSIVRAEVHRLAELRSDYMKITEKINRNKEILHSARLVRKPFAIVDQIADASPGVEDGLKVGDQILKFGNVEAGDNSLQKLSSEARSNVGRAVPVFILRQDAVIKLIVTPRTWQGIGLLGCHFRIL